MHMHVFKKPLLLVKTTQWSKLRHLLTFFCIFGSHCSSSEYKLGFLY